MRDISNAVNVPMTTGHYLKSMGKLTNQWSQSNFRDPKRQRLYLKDIDCPEAWYQRLQDFIPESLFYLNDCVGEKGGPGAAHERNMYNQTVLGKGIAPAGDLMSNLPEEMRAENMMCYIGHEGTYTPAHREMCASLGQNIMVETSTSENGELPGSSVWFMTESKDREVVSEYFLSMLGHDIEVENHFAQVNAWKKAPFPVYIVEQKVGDFILVPPLAPHQVWNRGTRTMKAAWNRTTVETLELALHEALPRARMVCRDEQYKCKAIVYYSLLRYYDQLKRVERAEEGAIQGYSHLLIRNSARVRQLQKDFKRLFALYSEMLVSEMFSPDLPEEKAVEFIPFDSNVTCSYCRCNIFNRFLTCTTCVGELDNGDEDTYDICMECYAMGRSCACMSNLKWVEQWQWSVLTQRYEQWRAMVISNNGYVDVDSSPESLEAARMSYGKKPVAQICQEQLKLRPWQDPNAEVTTMSPRTMMEMESPEPEVDDEGRIKKKKTTRRKSGQQKGGAFTNCHICCHTDYNWKLAFCTTCSSAYCYGTLWRAFDLKPQTVMEQTDWQCPKCLGICGCGRCRRKDKERNQNQKEPYRPKGTLLGHDTRKVADPRSVESLVDFRRTNLGWLRGEGDHDPKSSMRMQKLVQEALQEKAKDEVLEEEIMANSNGMQQDTPTQHEATHMAIDPLLWEEKASNMEGSQDLHPDVTNINSPNEFTSGKSFTHGVGGLHVHSTNRMGSDPTHRGDIALPGIMNASGSSYPDPSGLGHDRSMGMGYYHQTNDADRILFDESDSGDISTAPDSNQDISGDSHTLKPLDTKNLKRKAEGGPSNSDDNLKKQKLAQAKRENTTTMTNNNKLKRGKPLVKKLPLKRSKEPLGHVEELDRNTEDVMRSSKPSRLGFEKSSMESSNREISDDGDDHGGMFVPEEAFPARSTSIKTKSLAHTNASVEPSIPHHSPTARATSPGNSRRSRSVPEAHRVSTKSTRQRSKKSPEGIDLSQPPKGASRRLRDRLPSKGATNKSSNRTSGTNSAQSLHPGAEKGLNSRPRSSPSKNHVEDAHLSSPEPTPPANVEKGPRGRLSKTLTKAQDPSQLSHASPQEVPTVSMSPHQSADALHSGADEGRRSDQDHMILPSAVVVSSKKAKDPSRRVTFQEPLSTSESDSNNSFESDDGDTEFVRNRYDASIDPYYENLKMKALRELEAEEARVRATKSAPADKPIRKPILARKTVQITGPLGSIVPGSLQYKRPVENSKGLSLSERRALEGKTTKIVAKKPSRVKAPTGSPPSTSVSDSAQKVMDSSHFTPGRRMSFDSPYSGLSTSDDDDDESIPAHRPGSFNKSSGQLNSGGMLDGLRRGGMFNQVK